jgi:hypothetical protein
VAVDNGFWAMGRWNQDKCHRPSISSKKNQIFAANYLAWAKNFTFPPSGNHLYEVQKTI